MRGDRFSRQEGDGPRYRLQPYPRAAVHGEERTRRVPERETDSGVQSSR